ncbi:unnamed protein product, partial [Discosporangium mesarthrocarpum]
MDELSADGDHLPARLVTLSEDPLKAVGHGFEWYGYTASQQHDLRMAAEPDLVKSKDIGPPPASPLVPCMASGNQLHGSGDVGSSPLFGGPTTMPPLDMTVTLHQNLLVPLQSAAPAAPAGPPLGPSPPLGPGPPMVPPAGPIEPSEMNTLMMQAAAAVQPQLRQETPSPFMAHDGGSAVVAPGLGGAATGLDLSAGDSWWLSGLSQAGLGQAGLGPVAPEQVHVPPLLANGQGTGQGTDQAHQGGGQGPSMQDQVADPLGVGLAVPEVLGTGAVDAGVGVG